MAQLASHTSFAAVDLVRNDDTGPNTISFPGKSILFVFVLSTMMIPFQIRMVPLYIMVNSWKLSDTYTGLILPGLVQMDEYATVQLRVRRPTPPGGETAISDAVLATLAELIQAGREAGHAPAGIAVGAPGYIQPETGVILDATNLGVRNLPLGEIVAKAFDLPTVVIQDVKAAAPGETQFGAGAGATYTAFLNVGTGIAVGLILDGQVYQGAASRAAGRSPGA